MSDPVLAGRSALEGTKAGSRRAPSPGRRYWLCHLGGWTLWGGLSAPLAPWQPLVALVLTGMIATHQFRNVIHRRGWRLLPLPQLVPRVLAASLVCGALMTGVNLPWTLGEVSPGQQFAFFWSFSGISFGWFVVYFAFHYRERVRAAEAEKWRLALAARDADLAARNAELSAMRSQLHPHFLFNSLNGVRGLISVDPDRAQHAVTALSELLRFTLRLSERRTTPLSEELAVVGHYLALEQVRFGHRLAYEIMAHPDTHGCQVPPMIVQTLVENAVKHGIAHSTRGGSVEVDAFAEGPKVLVRVTNPGKLQDEASSSGIGLANARERLRLLFGDQARLELRAAGEERVVAELVIPKDACVSSAGTEHAASSMRAASDTRAPQVAHTGPAHDR